ncbi:MAG: TIGR03032 family protein, partial [Spirochaetes bacterium]
MSNPTFIYGRTLLGFLASHNITIALSSYQSHQILAIGVQNVEVDPDLAIYLCPIRRCMGMSRYKNRLVLSNVGNIMVYNSKGAVVSPKYGKFTDEYQPRFRYQASDVDIHDLKITEKGIFFVSASYNCVAMPSLEKTFEPYWIPPWIKPSEDGEKKYLRREDCCHLNGLCCVDGKPKYITATSRGNIAGHWRTHKSEGFVYDIQENEIVCKDIHSPHSPNWYNGKLWVLESGTGYFGYVDFKKKEFVKKVFLPGFLRGMTFFDKFAIICLSKDRHDHAFRDLPLCENLRCNGTGSVCGFRIIDMETFSVIEEFTFNDTSGVTELYDVVCLPGHRSRILSDVEVDAVNHYDKLESHSSFP